MAAKTGETATPARGEGALPGDLIPERDGPCCAARHWLGPGDPRLWSASSPAMRRGPRGASFSLLPCSELAADAPVAAVQSSSKCRVATGLRSASPAARQRAVSRWRLHEEYKGQPVAAIPLPRSPCPYLRPFLSLLQLPCISWPSSIYDLPVSPSSGIVHDRNTPEPSYTDCVGNWLVPSCLLPKHPCSSPIPRSSSSSCSTIT